MKRTLSLLLLTVSALALSACGLRGSLDRPPPLWGDPQDTASEAEADDESGDQDR